MSSIVIITITRYECGNVWARFCVRGCQLLRGDGFKLSLLQFQMYVSELKFIRDFAPFEYLEWRLHGNCDYYRVKPDAG